MKYYVVYISGMTIGSINIDMDTKIKSHDDIKMMEKYISEKYCNNKQVLILNWKKYE